MGPSDRTHDPETWAAHLDALHRGTVLDEDNDDRADDRADERRDRRLEVDDE